jgi:hypothetical protein
MMNRDAIERLAIDSAAGELNEDAQFLFEAYLAEHPGAKEWAQDMLQVYLQTQTAITSKTGAAPASIAAVSIKSGPPAVIRWRPVLRWAAVVCVAALVGAGAGRWSKAPVTADRPERVANSTIRLAAPANLDLQDAPGSFWRAKAAAMLEPRPYRQVNATMQAGGLWRKYEQYIKEKHHE